MASARSLSVDVPRSLADDGNRPLPRSERIVSHGPPGGLRLVVRCRLGKAANGTLIRISPIADLCSSLLAR